MPQSRRAPSVLSPPRPIPLPEGPRPPRVVIENVRPAGRRRPIPGQAGGRRGGPGGQRRRPRRRPRRARGGAPTGRASASEWLEARWQPGQRPVAGQLPRSSAGAPHYTVEAWTDRFRDLAAGPGQEGGRERGQDAGSTSWWARSRRRRRRERAAGADASSLAGSARDAARARRATARSAPSAPWRRGPRAMMRPLPRPRTERRVSSPRSGRAWIASAPAVRRLVRDVPALVRPAGPARRRSATRRRGSAYVAAMGFDVLYLPPIHPIGRVHRKGANNAPRAAPGDVGSPWAIGAREGGHTAIHPELGSLDDFRRFLKKARSAGPGGGPRPRLPVRARPPLGVPAPAVVQAAAGRHRPVRREPAQEVRGHLPHRLRDRGLAGALAGAARAWCGTGSVQGVRIFRVDNPHTKSFRFWEWLIAEVRRDYPETIFLAEAFTRPKVMYQLAKLGFTSPTPTSRGATRRRS